MNFAALMSELEPRVVDAIKTHLPKGDKGSPGVPVCDLFLTLIRRVATACLVWPVLKDQRVHRANLAKLDRKACLACKARKAVLARLAHLACLVNPASLALKYRFHAKN